jgi:hypothetical protein
LRRHAEIEECHRGGGIQSKGNTLWAANGSGRHRAYLGPAPPTAGEAVRKAHRDLACLSTRSRVGKTDQKGDDTRERLGLSRFPLHASTFEPILVARVPHLAPRKFFAILLQELGISPNEFDPTDQNDQSQWPRLISWPECSVLVAATSGPSTSQRVTRV